MVRGFQLCPMVHFSFCHSRIRAGDGNTLAEHSWQIKIDSDRTETFFSGGFHKLHLQEKGASYINNATGSEKFFSRHYFTMRHPSKLMSSASSSRGMGRSPKIVNHEPKILEWLLNHLKEKSYAFHNSSA